MAGKTRLKGGGIRIPDAIRNAPDLQYGLKLFYDAFWELNGDRPDSDRRIPWASVRTWAKEHELDPEATDLLHEYLSEMDIAYVAFVRHKGRGNSGEDQSDGKSEHPEGVRRGNAPLGRRSPDRR